MTPKMVAGFRRSLSFPNHPNSSSKPKKTFHVRSTSLPCRSHPLISQLRDDLNALMAAFSSSPENRTSAWLCDSLARLKTIHESLDDLLQLPQTRESLHGHAGLVENLLEDFLRFVDVYGIFQTMILRLKEEHQAAQVAVRRKDAAAKLASYSKAIKNLGKEMEKKLIPSLQSTAGKYLVLPKQVVAVPDGDAEVVGVMKDAVKVTVLVSTALFNGLSVSFTKSSSRRWMVGPAKKANMEEGIEEFKEMAALWGVRRKGEEEDVKMVAKKMHEMEDCIGGIESGGEKVFRSLMNAKVSLLNVFTQ
ncbi:PREDICTED: uncharacterized protein LOC109181231 [Ipomoea nil]|uniref:uncharacterized protein LOC109181231 n=1 Tax=Ipomoea nil TaxID=35883 RepID=UPI000901D2BA|nr:PREDICTED: uncharacterized protein LOC109181231 [Ipomoea nil]